MYRVSQSFWIYNGRKVNELIEGLYIGSVEKRSFRGTILEHKDTQEFTSSCDSGMGQSVLLSVVISKKINYYTFIVSYRL